MNSQNACGFTLIPIRLFQGPENVLLLKIVPSLKQTVPQRGSLCPQIGVQENLQGKIFVGDWFGVAPEHYQPLNQVLQLADVPWPQVTLQGLRSFGGEAPNFSV